MRAFIEDYIEWVREALGDPARNKRLTFESVVLRDLHAEHMVIFEELLNASANETVLGYTEATITLRSDTEFYPWPGNFRQFLGLERRLVDNPRSVTDRLGTKLFGSAERGIVISSAERGFRVTRVPIITEESQDWVLKYQKGPIIMHWADDAHVMSSYRVKLPMSIPESQGQIVRQSDYYAAEMFHIIDDVERNQSIEVRSYDPVSRELRLKEAMIGVTLNSNLKYEFRPFLPRGIDKLIAVSVALAKTSDRSDPVKHRLLVKERKKFLSAARNHFRTATQDRAPVNRGTGRMTVDPMAM